jgi:hypothetical protein
MKTVPLATFNELEPAQTLQQRLQQAGIPATIHDESKLERFAFMSRPLAAIHVEVPQPQYLEARQLIGIWDTEQGALSRAVRCPDCHSSRVEFPQLTRKFLTPALLRIFMSLRVIPQEFYCLDCHFTWPIKPPVERKLDILGFPEDSKFWHPEKVKTSQRT